MSIPLKQNHTIEQKEVVKQFNRSQDEDLFPGKLADLDHWASEIIDFAMRDEQAIFPDLSSSTSLQNDKESKVVTKRSVREFARQNVNQAVRNSELVLGSLMEGFKLYIDNSSTNSSHVFRLHPTKQFHLGTTSPFSSTPHHNSDDNKLHYNMMMNAFTYQYIVRRPLIGLLQNRFFKNLNLDQTVSEPLFDENKFRANTDSQKQLYSTFSTIDTVIRNVLGGRLDFKTSLYPDKTLAFNFGFECLPFLFQSEFRLGFQETRKLVSEGLFGFKFSRANIEVFRNYTQDAMGLMMLFRPYKTANSHFDIGGELFFVEGGVSNASYGMRFNTLSKDQRRSSFVWCGNAMGLLNISYASDISRKYGICAASQMRYSTTDASGDAAVGIQVSPKKEWLPQLNEEYDFKGRMDTEKGFAFMVRKRNFFRDNISVALSLSNRSPIPIHSYVNSSQPTKYETYQHYKADNEWKYFGSWKLGVGVVVNF